MATRRQLLNLDYYAPVFSNAIPIVLILVFAYIATRAVARLLLGLRNYSVKMMLKSGGTEYELEKRAETIHNLSGKTFFVLIWIIAALMILKEMSFDVRPLLAGAGVAGVAIGFGAQNIIKDVLGGMFMMMENQIRVNDIAVINGKTGLVEEINLRTTVLRGEDGAVHIFPNGTIQGLSNLTREYSFYVSILRSPTPRTPIACFGAKWNCRRARPGRTLPLGRARSAGGSGCRQTGRLLRRHQSAFQDHTQSAVAGGP
jgi:small-conductance mechanosensitive channel